MPRVKIPNQNIDKTYSFDCSKEELRDRILRMYSYNKPVIGLMFKKYRITNVDINKKYFDRVAIEKYPIYATIEAEIRNPTQDTIRIRMSRNAYTSIQSTFIISGDNVNSSLHLTVIDLELFPKDVYDKNGIKREESYFTKKYLEAIEKKFLNQLRKK
jgi:hypothetical protein